MYHETKEQKTMIEATEGYIRCGAVPGSGKTFCITYRIAYLIQELYVDPASIVALTFTNKAASSMCKRLKQIIGDEATCFTGTFHGYCNKILKEEIYRLSYPKTFTILDKKDQINLIREIAEEQSISLKDHTAKAFLDYTMYQKLTDNYVSIITGTDKNPLLELVASATTNEEKVFYHYLKKQWNNYALDFEDIMNFTLYILQNYKDALDVWQNRCQYILCDEYQDINMRQGLLLALLSGRFGNLTVVGDDDQCIYGWRGSKVDYMLLFSKDYPKAKDYYLSENFRSTPEIIATANSLIAHNQNRLEKKMFTNNPSGSKPVYHNLPTEKNEAEWIADTILSSVKQNKTFNDHTVLVRASSQTRALEEVFIRKKVPYRILSGAQFYETEEIKTALSYLRIIYAMSDLDFSWTIQHPRRGFGKKSIEKLQLYAEEKGISLFEALGEQITSGTEKRQHIIDYYNGIVNLNKSYTNYSCKDILNLALDLGYRAELTQDIDQTKLNNVTELIATITELETEHGEQYPLEELLAHFSLFTAQDDDTKKDVVRIMTIHTAKGLEFDTVFINGLVDGQFPSSRLRNEDELEEERRLLYVAITRAKNKLYLSSYDVKNSCFFMKQSSFLGDIDINTLECIHGSTINTSSKTLPMLPKNIHKIGDIVNHKVFGTGKVLNLDTISQTYDIEFAIGTRRIQFRFFEQN